MPLLEAGKSFLEIRQSPVVFVNHISSIYQKRRHKSQIIAKSVTTYIIFCGWFQRDEKEKADQKEVAAPAANAGDSPSPALNNNPTTAPVIFESV